MIMDKIVEVLSAHIGVSPEKITENTSFKDLNLDSLDVVELMMELEEAFGVTIEPEEGINTVGDLIRHIENSMK